MKHKLLIWVGLALLPVCLGAEWLGLTIPAPLPACAYDRIRLGMTLHEVTEAVGMPPDDYSSNPHLPPSMSPSGEYVRKVGLSPDSLPDICGRPGKGYNG